MKTFAEIFNNSDWEKVRESIFSKTSCDVEIALEKNGKKNLEDFKALISPAAENYLEEMAQLSHRLTQKRFGKTIQLYVPLYLSNECRNICTYCAFSYDNKIKRITLNEEQIQNEISEIKKMGIEHILIVTGEANNSVEMEYFRKIIPIIQENFSHISFEVQPLEQNEYEELISLGVNAVLVYQETYNKTNYKNFHPKGKKSNFYYRLETPERLGKAGIYKIGLGVLLGLSDWRTDSFFCASHLDFLEKNFWQTKYSVSFPRLRPIRTATKSPLQLERGFRSEAISDKQLVQLICAYRIFNEELELSISTRESEKFRNNIVKLGVTTMSAGSKTNPGGYFSKQDSLEQFEISDERSVEEIAAIIKSHGYEPVWKDWDRTLQITNQFQF